MKLNVNGKVHDLDVSPDMPILWVLRDILKMKGTKFGCGKGLCGACTVQLNGQAIRSCSVPVSTAENQKLTTIEGLQNEKLIAAWTKHNVPQCGYCQPGQLMTAAAFIAQNKRPSDNDIETMMSGNICRCGTYPRIKAAIKTACYGEGRVMSVEQISRRDFLKHAGIVATSGLFFKLSFPKRVFAAEHVASGDFVPSVWLGISKDNVIRLVCHRSEMGQSVLTSMPMLIAEELEVSLDKVKIIQGDGDERYGDQNTDGSSSARLNWDVLRTAGATAREMLIQAAAKKWKVDPKECVAKDGHVIHSKTKKSLNYGQLAQSAAKETAPQKPRLKSRKQFTIVGKPKTALNIQQVLTGTAEFGIDIDLPDMLYASIERTPALRGKIREYNAKAAKAVKGVVDVIEVKAMGSNINCVNGIAVIANSTWAANMGRDALAATWKNESTLENTAEFTQALVRALDGKLNPMRKEGDVDTALKKAKTKHSATYHVPYLVHAPMEPLNATALVKKDSCEIWAPIQDPQRTQKAVAQFLNIKPDQVHVHVTLLGGGFGRKSQPDFAMEAVQLSQATGKPVKVTWTREDEIKHGFYHAQSAQTIEAAVDEQGNLKAWRHRSAYPTIMTVWDPAANSPADWEIGMGATDMPYRSPNVLVEATSLKSGVNIGWLRSVCNIQHAFAINSFIDELAHVQKKDPIDYRLQLLGAPREIPILNETWKKPGYPFQTDRLAKVIKRLKSTCGWNRKRPKGTGMGFAAHYSFFSYVALALEVKVKDSELQVTNAHCVVDLGSMVNPDTVRAQVEGGIIFGLSLALNGKITLKDGVVEQNNFDDYPVLRMSECPKFHIELLKSDAPPAGIGEPGTPPVAPALCSAIFAATGKRIRNLPVIPALSN